MVWLHNFKLTSTSSRHGKHGVHNILASFHTHLDTTTSFDVGASVEEAFNCSWVA
jgi:hypothetical protein